MTTPKIFRTKAGNATKGALQRGYVQRYRRVRLRYLPSGVYLVTMATPGGEESHMTRRLQTAREKFREFAAIADRDFPHIPLAIHRVTVL